MSDSPELAKAIAIWSVNCRKSTRRALAGKRGMIRCFSTDRFFLGGGGGDGNRLKLVDFFHHNLRNQRYDTNFSFGISLYMYIL